MLVLEASRNLVQNHVYVNLREAHGMIDRIVALRRARASLPIGDGMTKKVVVVDDNEFDISMLRRGLNTAGADIDLIEVNDSGKAVSVISSEEPVLAILDVSMPVLDGFEVLSAVRAHARLTEIRVLMLSGSTSVTDRHKAEQLGVNWYRVKPETLDGYRQLGTEIIDFVHS
ncbi:MAG: response regulator [Hoeflea sp.]|uniref:response regulator n=1 Tax=Hoeflea sp. TaxID=1940281 RepID=UPI0032985CC2